MNKTVLFVIIILGLLFIFGTTFVPKFIVEQRLPGSTTYGFPVPYLHDYFQYIGFINNGIERRHLMYNQFSEIPDPPPILQPFYYNLGLISGILRLSPFFAYEEIRLLMLLMLFGFFLFLINKTLHNPIGSAIGVILLLFGTAFWQITSTNGTQTVTDPETYSNWFNSYLRITSIPPHHYLAVCLLGALVYRLSHPQKTFRAVALSFGMGLYLGITHPYIAVFMVAILMANGLLQIIITRKIPKVYFLHALVAGIGAAPIVLWHRYVLFAWFHDKSIVTEGTTIWSPPSIPMTNYLLAFGTPMLCALFVILQKKTWHNPLTRLLIVWATVPFLMFYLPNIGLPTGGVRLFQVFQHLPLSILGAMSLLSIAKHIPWEKFRPIFLIIASVAIILYAIPSYLTVLQSRISPQSNYFYVYHLLTLGQPIITYLQKNSADGSVVMGTDLISMLIPPFSHNKIILGEDGNNPDPYRKRAEVGAFFAGDVPIADLPEFFKRYRTSYVIFGIGSLELDRGPYAAVPFFKRVVDQGGVTLVKVELPPH